MNLTVEVTKEDGTTSSFEAVCRLDTPVEIDYYRNGGILQTVLRSILKRQAAGTGTPRSGECSESNSEPRQE